MKNTKFLVVSATLILVFIALFIMNPKPINAAEKGKNQCFIVSIRGTDQEMSISPKHIKVPKGSCVVWVNWIEGPDISISFKDGKTCEEMTKSPLGFRLTPETGCYLTDYLPQGGTSSLRFMIAGDYTYEISMEGKKEPLASGKITVKK